MQTKRVAVVTGAASGIGLASAELLAADGFSALLLDRSDQVTERAAAIREKGLGTDSLVGDLIEPATIPLTRNTLARPLRPVRRADEQRRRRVARVRQGAIFPERFAARVGIRRRRQHDRAVHAVSSGVSVMQANKWGRHGITANAIAPGRVVTPLSSQTPDDMVQEALKQIPVRRLGVPTDIAAAVSFLASEESSFITGAGLGVNGGGFMA